MAARIAALTLASSSWPHVTSIASTMGAKMAGSCLYLAIRSAGFQLSASSTAAEYSLWASLAQLSSAPTLVALRTSSRDQNRTSCMLACSSPGGDQEMLALLGSLGSGTVRGRSQRRA